MYFACSCASEMDLASSSARMLCVCDFIMLCGCGGDDTQLYTTAVRVLVFSIFFAR